MISDPTLVRYTCIAHCDTIDSPDSTILAEFNSADSSLQELAQQCLHFTPPHHVIYSQVFRKQTYTFLLDYPFVYFGIFEPNMIKFDQMKLLERLKEALNHIINSDPDKKLSSYCLQGEFHPIFHKLMAKSSDFDAPKVVAPPPNGVHHNQNNGNDNKISVHSVSGSSKGRKIMALPMLSSCKIGKGFKKRISGESATDSKQALVDGKVDVLDHWGDDMDVGEVKSREITSQNEVFLIDDNVGRHKAKKIWRRHVWIVLVLDLAVCLILFGIWLFVCGGFECIER